MAGNISPGIGQGVIYHGAVSQHTNHYGFQRLSGFFVRYQATERLCMRCHCKQGKDWQQEFLEVYIHWSSMG